MKPNRNRLAFKRKLVCVAVASCFTVMPAFANPIGASVASGQVGFAAQGSTLTITNSPNAIINWQQFSISPGEITRFIQQSASSAVLNRVLGQDPSQILGSLLSNGRVFLVNPNGIVFGQGAVVDVAGLVASTLRLSDGDFLAGRLNFTGGVGAGSIDNQGAITTPNGGNIYLIAPDIRNSGLITSPQGEILLAAGHTVNLVDAANPDVQVTLSAPDSRAVNIGTLMAQSGRIGIYGALIGQQGAVNADTAVLGANGRIMLRATKDIILEPGSVTTASGLTGGVRDGGEIRIVADGTLNMRPGSQVRVDGGADGGNGGFLELSGKQKIALNGTYTGRARKDGFRGGELLLDPLDIVICADPLSCTGSTSGAPPVMLSAGTVLHSSSASSTLYLNPNMNGASGSPAWSNVSLAALRDITVASAITDADVAPGGSLTMNAGNNINIRANIGTSTSARFNHDLTLQAGNNVNINASIYMGGNTLLVRSGAIPSQLGNIPSYACTASCAKSIYITPTTANPVTVDVQGGIQLYAPSNGAVNIMAGMASNNQDASVGVHGGTVTVDAGSVIVQAGNVVAGTSGSSVTAKANAELWGDTQVNITTTSGSLEVKGGSASASAGNNGYATANADATLKSDGTMTLVVANGMAVRGGSGAIARVGGDSGSNSATATTRASVLAVESLGITIDGGMLVAGGDMATANGSSGGFAVPHKATADASASVRTTGGDITLTVHSPDLSYNALLIRGGDNAIAAMSWGGSSGLAYGAHTLDVKSNAEFVASGGITISVDPGAGYVEIRGGSGVQTAYMNAGSSAATITAAVAANAQLVAEGGTLTLTAPNLTVRGGNGVKASSFRASGPSNVNVFDVAVHADATLKSSAAMTLTVGGLTVAGGSSVAAYVNTSGATAVTVTANALLDANSLTVGPADGDGINVLGGGVMGGSSGAYAYAGSGSANQATAEAKAAILVANNLDIAAGSGSRISTMQIAGGIAWAYARGSGIGRASPDAMANAGATVTAGSVTLRSYSLAVAGGHAHAQVGTSSAGASNRSATAESKALLQVNGSTTLDIGSGGLAVMGGTGGGCFPCTAQVYGVGGVNSATADRSALISVTGAASLTVAGSGITVAGGSADARVRGAGSNTATENADAAIQVTGSLDISDGAGGRIASALISGGYAWTDVHGASGSGGASAFANASVTAGSLVLRTDSLTVKGGNTAHAWAGSGSGNEVIDQSATAESKALLQVNGSVTAMDIGSGGMLVEALCNCGTAQVYGAGGVNSATADRSAFVRVTGDLAALTVAGGGVTVRGGNATATAYGTSGANTATEYANAGIDVGGTLQTGAGGIAGGLTVQGGGAFGSGARAYVSGGSNQATAYGGAEITAGAVNITVATGDLAISGGIATASASSGIGASADARALVTVTGAQVFNIAAGNVSLTGGSPAASGAGATAQANVLLSSQAGGNAVVLAASGNFINNAGATPINLMGGGRWLVYSNDPASDTFGGLDSVNTAIWNATYASKLPASVAQTGNRYLFNYQPTLTFTSTSTSKVYGADATAAVAAAYGVSGLDPGVANAYLADSNATVFSGAPAVASGGSAVAAVVSGSPYAITVAQGGLSALSGYAFAYQSSGLLTVNPLAVILTGSKVDDGTPTFIAGQLGIGNIVGSDVVSLSGGTADAADAVVGSNKPFVSFAGLALAGALAGNYTLTGVSGTGTITSAAPPPPPAPVAPAALDNPVVVAALDFGNGETNDSAKVGGFVPTIFFGNEGEKEKKDDIPVCN